MATKTKIKADFKPNDRMYELMVIRYPELTIDQAIEFVSHELADFIYYWQNTGKPMADWHSTCLNRMKDLYAWKKEQMAKDRRYSGPQGDIFDKVLDNLQVPEPEPVKRNYRLPDPPQYTETMSASDALDELSKLRRRLNA